MVNSFIITFSLIFILGIIYYFNIKNVLVEYMDEEFHVRQTIAYFNNSFSDWDPKLTTFPGLFLFGAFAMKIGVNFVEFNGLRFLRLLNVCLFFTQNSILDNFIAFSSHENTSFLKLLIIFLPINFFYGFLYYTDTLSIVLIIYYFYINIYKTEKFKNENKKYYFLIGLFCVLARQNNIIWVNIFPLAHVIEKFIMERIIRRSENLFFSSISSSNENSKVNDINQILSNNDENNNSILNNKYSVLKENKLLINKQNEFNFIQEIKNTLKEFVHLVILDLLFILFVIFNKFSIVLGDKTSHDLVLHLAQINHSMIFALFFFPCLNLISIYFVFNHLKALISKKNIDVKRIILFILISSLVYILISFFDKYSYVHDFLIADNRHYSFYYFKRIYLNPLYRKVILAYVSFTFSVIIFENLEIFSNSLLVSWILCSFLAIVPAKLFEFRYFSPIYITFLLILHSYLSAEKLRKFIFNYFNVVWSLIINAITIYVFLFRPFFQKEFPGDLSRFMW